MSPPSFAQIAAMLLLAAMAYGDAQAAEVLGLRKLGSDDPLIAQEGLQLIYRAVALSNSSEPMW